MHPDDRSTLWKEVWTRKGLERSMPLHHLDGYNLLTAAEWDHMIAQVTEPLALRAGDRVLECGCGAGAFLAALQRLHPGIAVTGVDYSPTLLDRAREHLVGEFHLGNLADLAFLPSGRYDATLSFGVFLYLSSVDDAMRALGEMWRVTRPGGRLYVGEVSDAARRGDAERIRQRSHAGLKQHSPLDLDHLYLPKAVFEAFAEQHGLAITIRDHAEFDLGTYEAAQYRYSVYMTRPAGGA